MEELEVIPRKLESIISPDKRKAIDDLIKSGVEYARSSARDFEFSDIISNGGFPPHIKP